MNVTVTLSEETARRLAELVRHELRAARYESVLHLRLSDDAETRDELRELELALDS